ncbi:MAG TPA: ATP-binding cassette domain-containing protein [Bacteroidetes bacterium]|nr:ATP-binding cassette domain-containing protein [Bacteroidota bacterium]
MISVQQLTKIYGTQKAIDSINFEIGAGEIVGFLGPNGAGKTTTMKIITCFMPPSSGTVQVDDLNIENDALAIRKRIGYLPEHNPLYLDMYVHEFLRFVGRLYKLSAADLKKQIPNVIEMTGLGREQHKKIGMLSKGFRQRVGLSQALIHDPDILILDEPTTGLDPNQIVEIRNLIKTIGKEKTIIFSTHILPEVESIADRVMIINRGKIVADETISALRGSRGKENVLRIGFDKPGAPLATLLEAHPEANLRQEDSEGLEFVIHTPENLDLRREIFEMSLAQQNPIRLLQQSEKNLEEIFRSLTQTP